MKKFEKWYYNWYYKFLQYFIAILGTLLPLGISILVSALENNWWFMFICSIYIFLAPLYVFLWLEVTEKWEMV